MFKKILITGFILSILCITGCSKNEVKPAENNINSELSDLVVPEQDNSSDSENNDENSFDNNIVDAVNNYLEEFPIAYKEEIDSEFINNIGLNQDIIKSWYGFYSKDGSSSIILVLKYDENQRLNIKASLDIWFKNLYAEYSNVSEWEKEKIQNIVIIEQGEFIIIAIPEAKLLVDDFGWNYVKNKCSNIFSVI